MNSGDSQIEVAVLSFVRRFRLTIRALIPLAIEHPVGEVEQAIASLIRKGLIRRHSPGDGVELLLYCQGSKRRRAPSNRNQITSLATIHFCHFLNAQRELLTPEEFKSHFPELHKPQHDRRYFLDRECSPVRLGFLRIDHGGDGRWNRIIDKARRDFDKHRRDPAFADLISNQWFEVHIVTGTKRKAIRIEQTVRQTRRRSDEAIRVTAIPELLPFILNHGNFSRL